MRSNHQSYGAKHVCCPNKTNFMGAIAPTAPMVPTPMYNNAYSMGEQPVVQMQHRYSTEDIR